MICDGGNFTCGTSFNINPERTTIALSTELAGYQFPVTAKAFLEARGESTFARRELDNPFGSFWQDRLFIDELDLTDTASWFSEWYRWMMSLSELRPVALQLEDLHADEDDLERWIDDAVDGFSKMRSNRFVTTVATAIKEKA